MADKYPRVLSGRSYGRKPRPPWLCRKMGAYSSNTRRVPSLVDGPIVAKGGPTPPAPYRMM